MSGLTDASRIACAGSLPNAGNHQRLRFPNQLCDNGARRRVCHARTPLSHPMLDVA
ncbi:hypothetical protein [Cupriavidus taiwanensis]|uniref:hypothetical protein n=1 Tax=Cupriavidus taiwanensis TaxID=164546 RepID=UPI001558F038|nr:hypothetical protein [Cupriavidus taiwanensis]